MTRIMFWNVEAFSVNKIANPSNGRQNGARDGLTQAAGAADRLQLMFRLIIQANPDILSIVEVRTGAGNGVGGLATEKGLNGARTLLLNLQWLNADWRLVPPLCTSHREAVAVFYRSTNYVFSGPCRWTGGVAGTSATGIPGALYGPPADEVIGANVVPAGSSYNPGAQENVCAAQVDGWTAYPAGPMPPLAPRPPYFTTFAQVAGGPPRDIALFSLHAPASDAAPDYLKALAQTNEVARPLAAAEVRVVAGDFNINLLDNTGNLNAAYNALTTNPPGYALALTPPPPPPGGLPPGAPGYYATHIKRPQNAQFWSTQAMPSWYPGYGYIGSDTLDNHYAIDNMFTRGGAPAGFTILNPVVGSPFIPPAPPPPYHPPLGVVAVNRRGGLPPPDEEPPPPPLPPNPALPLFSGGNRTFQGWNNYGRIRSTSDHFAIVMDV